METNNSKFWIGLGLGSIIGFVTSRFSCSSMSSTTFLQILNSFMLI